MKVDKHRFIAVEQSQRTNRANSFVIGHVIGRYMIANKVVHERKVAAGLALAIEKGADATGLVQNVHPHPTRSETVSFAAEMFDGSITDLIPPKRKASRK